MRLLLPVVGRKLSEGSSHSVSTNDSGFVRIVLPKGGGVTTLMYLSIFTYLFRMYMAHVLETSKTEFKPRYLYLSWQV